MRTILRPPDEGDQPRDHHAPEPGTATPAETGRAVLRTTRQRLAVAELLASSNDFHSARELHAALQEHGDSVGLATVYRNLALMVESGEVDVLSREDGEAVYLACSQQHHHHLVCRSCGHAIEIAGPAVEQWAQDLADLHGYSEVTHTFEVFGICPKCAHP